jgi:farnesyl diphosphate synthase
MTVEESAAAFGLETSATGRDADLRGGLAAAARDVEQALEGLLPQPHGRHARVAQAMRYAVFAGGKRLRPFLTLECARLFAVPRERALRVAAAVEALHTYSLVHDDLPAMDDDDLRRGRPTTHRRFDEATAILAGDALLTLAFEILAESPTDPRGGVRARLVASLARAAGSDGMVGGQMIDIEAPQRRLDEPGVVDLQRRKTGALFEFSCLAGGLLAAAGEDELAALRAYAADLGLAFQICDDLIDVSGSVEAAGKRVGKDQAQGKATLVSLYGVDGARARARDLAHRARTTIGRFGRAAERLETLPFYLLDRRN